jgi:hypothetical protein
MAAISTFHQVNIIPQHLLTYNLIFVSKDNVVSSKIGNQSEYWQSPTSSTWRGQCPPKPDEVQHQLDFVLVKPDFVHLARTVSAEAR